MYTREELIEICKKGRVTYDKWIDRDSCSSQQKLMLAGLLLESDCKFKVRTEENQEHDTSPLFTDEDTIWIDIYYDEWEGGEDWHVFYLPTEKRLKDVEGADWY